MAARTLKRAFKEFQDDNATDWAAGLTYYSVLSLFPGIIVLFSLLGVLGQYPETTNALLDIVSDLGPARRVDTLSRADRGRDARYRQRRRAPRRARTLGAIWSASGYLGAFARASNAIYEVEEGRPFWKMRPQQVGMTILMIFLLAIIAISLVVSGPVAEAIGDVIGVGSTAVTVWGIAKWPVMILLVAFLCAILFYWAPNVEQPSSAGSRPAASSRSSSGSSPRACSPSTCQLQLVLGDLRLARRRSSASCSGSGSPNNACSSARS